MAVSAVSSSHFLRETERATEKKAKSRPGSIWQATSSYLKTSAGIRRLVISPVELSCRWAKWNNPSPSKGLDRVCQLARNTTRVLTITGFPSQIVQFVASCQEPSILKRKGAVSERKKAIVKVAVEAIGLTGPVSASIALAREICILKPSNSLLKALKIVGGVGSGASIVGSILNILKEVDNLLKPSGPSLKEGEKTPAEKHKISLGVLKIASSLLAIILAALGIASLLLSSPLTPLLFLILSTASLTLGLGTYFYELAINPSGT